MDLDEVGDSVKYFEKSLVPNCFISLTLELFLKIKVLGEAKDFLPQGLGLLRN